MRTLVLILLLGCSQSDPSPTADAEPELPDAVVEPSHQDEPVDEVVEPPDETSGPVGAVRLTVRTLDGSPVAGALVRLGDAEASTDDAGQALFEAVTTGRVTYTVDAADLCLGAGTAEVLVGEQVDTSVWLDVMTPEVVSEEGGAVVESDFELTLPGFIRDGAPAAGDVDVDWVVVRDAQHGAVLPGDGRGEDATGQPVSIQPLMALEVRLSQDGEPVGLSSPARMRLEGLATSPLFGPLRDHPLLQGLATSPLGILEGLATSPLGFELVHYDPNSGLWRPEGTLDFVDGGVEAELPHFSWWALALTLPDPVCASGVVVDPLGVPVGGADVRVRWGGLGWTHAVSGIDGAFCVDLPVGAEAELQVTTTDGVGTAVGVVPLDCVESCDVFGTVSLEIALPTDADQDGAPAPGPDVAPGTADCDDDDPEVHPGHAESCDARDEDCDGVVDAGAVDAITWFRDEDLDGVGLFGQEISACELPPGHAATGGDCDDANPDRTPGAEELCDGVDEDCDGQIDDDATDAMLFWPDLDEDGFGDDAGVGVLACEQPALAAPSADDCDDTDAETHPGAREVCDDKDQDCDGVHDDDAVDMLTLYLDTDLDGYGVAVSSMLSCTVLSGYAEVDGDCQPTNPTVHPGQLEWCNAIDDDCDGVPDDDPVAAPQWVPDLDGDGHGSDSATPVAACVAPPQHVSVANDCDDADPTIHPSMSETCDGRDQNCSGIIDDNPLDGINSWPDVDGDDFGADRTAPTKFCGAEPGWAQNRLDCNDNDQDTHPNGTEVCNGLDDDCNGLIDVDDNLQLTGDVNASSCMPECVVVAAASEYFVWCERPVTWLEAHDECGGFGMELATPVLDEAHAAAFSVASGQTSWLGADDGPAEGDWRWEDGSLVTLPGEVDLLEPSRWATSQPDNAGDFEHCMVIQQDGQWNDMDCDGNLPYVCEAPR